MANPNTQHQQDLQTSFPDIDQSLQAVAVAAAAAAAAAASGLQHSNSDTEASYPSAHAVQAPPDLSADDILNLVPTGSSPESANIIAAAAHAAAIAAAASNASAEHSAMEGAADDQAHFTATWPATGSLDPGPSVAPPPPHARLEELSYHNAASGSDSLFESPASISSGPSKPTRGRSATRSGLNHLTNADELPPRDSGQTLRDAGIAEGSSSPSFNAEDYEDDQDVESQEPQASSSAQVLVPSASSSRSRKRKLANTQEEAVPSRVGTAPEQKEWRAVMQARLASMNTSSRHVQTTQKRFLEDEPELSQPLTICEACTRNKLPCYLAPPHPKCFSCVLKGETCSLALIRHSRKRKALAEQDTVLSQARTEYVNRWRSLKQDLVNEARKHGADDLAELVEDKIGACIEEMESDLQAWVPKDPVAFLKSGKL
ncbi:hypothetical protein OC845_002166 [Tilletia horrida]|nr:hypothetical protein OC845_002166 [Tilletia horrida]